VAGISPATFFIIIGAAFMDILQQKCIREKYIVKSMLYKSKTVEFALDGIVFD
jgi:hypothetical protein